MEILFHQDTLLYNQTSTYEGKYRLEKFTETYSNTDVKVDPHKYIEKIHTKRYIDKIRKACEIKQELVGLHLSPDCFQAALTAISLSIQAAGSGHFAVVRPPGHHANREKASGFCLFNNIAIATQHLTDQGKKVAILDLDGHHGDGTQSILSKNPNAFYCSIHQSDVFPGTGIHSSGNFFNLPLKPPIAENVYLVALEKCIKQINIFSPDILGVSMGFDTYKDDSLLDFKLNIESYKKIGHILSQNYSNIFTVLEGGYHNQVKECVESFVMGINSSLEMK